METWALLEDLKKVVMDTCAFAAQDPSPLKEDNPYAAKLCFVLEKILSHGLIDTAIFGKTYFWAFVKNIDECLPSTQAIVTAVCSATRSSCGKGRVFLRLVLNQKSLADCLSALVWNRVLVEKHYRAVALLRKDDDVSIFLLLLENLNGVNFSLRTIDPSLDNENYWSTVSFSSSFNIQEKVAKQREREKQEREERERKRKGKKLL
mmetsp:Transcript_26502/g.36942  ORF Transcript_26502/g.36942 Transcript_26502/m.36942 type:complete len:206 (-) Transcript_26502:30-647(-)